MKILVIGGTGTIGSAVVEALSAEHEVIPVGSSSGAYRVELDSGESIRRLFEQTGQADAVISCAGRAAFNALEQLTDEQFALSVNNKLMGQVNLVRFGLPHISDGGSFTLTSGLLSREPSPGSAAISMVNAGLEGFVRAAALEMPRGIRINVVSPPWIGETLQRMGRDPSGGLPAATVAKAYMESVQGRRNGEMLDARDYA